MSSLLAYLVQTIRYYTCLSPEKKVNATECAKNGPSSANILSFVQVFCPLAWYPGRLASWRHRCYLVFSLLGRRKEGKNEEREGREKIFLLSLFHCQFISDGRPDGRPDGRTRAEGGRGTRRPPLLKLRFIFSALERGGGFFSQTTSELPPKKIWL